MIDLETYALRARDIYSGSTLARRLKTLRQYARFLEERGLEPGPESLALWLDELRRRGLSPNSIRAYAQDVMSYFDVMMVGVDERELERLRRTLPPIRPRPVDYLTDEEVARLIRATPSPVRRLIYALMYAYARRLGEVLALTWRDVDLERKTITFTILKKRVPERATFPLEPWIERMIVESREHLGRERLFELTERAVERAFKRDCVLAGIRPGGRRLRPHILRHSRITSLRDKGVPLDIVSKYLARHSRYETTVLFYRAVTEREAAGIPPAGEVLGIDSQSGH
ncbi:MAG: tyrosine-type recombinase/integrase [Thermofilaceae archaeon]